MIVYVCSPYAGDVKGNTRRAVRFCRYAMSKGHTPVAPHLLYPQMLNDDVPAERERALAMGVQLLDRCDELWVYGKVISHGMAKEIMHAVNTGITVRLIREAVA